MSNLLRYPNLNHAAWGRSFYYLTRIQSVPSPKSTTHDVFGFIQKRDLGFCYCYKNIANTKFNRKYRITLWARTTDQNWKIQAYLYNNHRRRRRTNLEVRTVSSDNQWHQLTWVFTNPQNVRAISINFRLWGSSSNSVKHYLYYPELLDFASIPPPSSSTDSTDNNTDNTASSGGQTTTGGSNTSTVSGSFPSLQSFMSIYQDKINAVVNIMMQAQNNDYYSGTGFFVSSDGYIATAAHVVVHGNTPPEAYAKNIYIHYYPENKVIKATIVGVDRLYDVALLKVNLTNRKYLAIADSRKESIGSFAIAMGQPLGNHVQSITSGIIRENKGQDYSWMAESLIVDFEIIGGNSGGPVLNINGHLIGIVSWGLTVGAFSLNGAIATHAAKKVIDYAMSRHSQGVKVPIDYPSSYLGISFEPVDMYHTVVTNLSKVEGVIIITVEGNSPAANAGLKVNDVITHVDNVLVGKQNNQVPLGTILHFIGIGKTLTLRVLRTPNYGAQNIKVTTARLPSSSDYIFSNKFNIDQLNEKKLIIHT